MLKVLGSSSRGNCYLLQGEKETLILECGISFKQIKEALNYDLSQVVGTLVTHEHGDHSKSIKDVIAAGIDVYLSQGTAEALEVNSHRSHIIKSETVFNVGGYMILPFDVKHDCNEPLGFLIRHKEAGNILFATDTYYIEYTFDNLNHILIECNYSLDILNQNVDSGKVHPAMKKRVMRSHFELENVKEFLRANDLREVRNVVLLHLSDGNSDAVKSKTEIEEVTGKRVYVADKGLEVDVSLYPF
jgi:phosphoribosyl 1,2-cyclic phosphodiesterase